jgi:hypothetical protein
MMVFSSCDAQAQARMTDSVNQLELQARQRQVSKRQESSVSCSDAEILSQGGECSAELVLNRQRCY